MAALGTLQADVLQGRAVANETAAALLPLIANADPIVAGLETSGALKRLAQGDSVQLPYMAELARHAYGTGQRGILLCANMAELAGTAASRQRKRPRREGEEQAEEAGAAAGGNALYFPPKQGPGTATTLHPLPPELPTLAVRRFSYIGIDAGQRQAYVAVVEQMKGLYRTDPDRWQQLKDQSEQLPGTFQWKAAEFQRMIPQGARVEVGSAITAAAREGSLLWLTLRSVPELTAERSIVLVSGLHIAVDGYRAVKKVEGGRIAIAALAAAPAFIPDPAGACIKVTPVLENTLKVYYFRLESAPGLQQNPMAAALPVPQPLPQLQFPVQPMIEGSMGLPALQPLLPWMAEFFQQQAPPAVAQPLPGLGPLPTAAAGADVPGGSSMAGGGGVGGGAPEAPVAALDDDALSDKAFKSATLGLGQMVQAPPGVDLPSNPALDVRNDAVLRKDVFVLGNLFTPGGQVLELSDERFKTQVCALEGSLALVGRLNAVEFSWAVDPSGARTAGFLAQQLERVLPQAVHMAENGTRYVSMTSLIPHLVAALQSLHCQQLAQGDDLDDLRERLAALEALLPAVAAGGFQELVEWQAEQAAEAGRVRSGKALGRGPPPGTSVTGRGPTVQYAVSPGAACLFAGKSPASIASILMAQLQEPNASIGKKYQLQSWAMKFGPAVMAQLFLDATQKPTSLDAKGNQRSPAAEFIQLAKTLEREQQQGNRMEEAAAAMETDGRELRDYQRRILAQISVGNWIIVAPTGAGKTEIAVRHSAALLERDPKAKVVFLAPTVNLADQQAAEFRLSPPFNAFRFRVECRCGGKSVAPHEWGPVIKSCSVLVLTPEIFRNLLASGAARLDDISLLVLDECHNSNGESPMAAVLKMYADWLQTQRAGARVTQVVGFTASPASKTTLTSTFTALDLLKERLLAEYIVLPSSNAELATHVHKAEDRRIPLQPRVEDRMFAERVGRWILEALELLGNHLAALTPDGELPPELHLRSDEINMIAFGMFCGAVEAWFSKAAKLIATSQRGDEDLKTDLSSCVMLLTEALTSLSVAGNLGCEAAARQLAQLVARTVQKLLGLTSDVLLGRAEGASASSGWAGASGLDGLVMELVRQLCQQVLGLDTLAAAYRDGIAGSPKSPKYVQLTEVLLSYQRIPNAHGIIFIRTRNDARVLLSILQADSKLGFFQLHLLMGHGTGGSDGGMKVVEQREARESFAQEGQHLLVATAAAEEGLNIPSCQFVVRFNSPQTGRERLQAKGRTRMPGSVYYELVDEGTLEERLANKSEQEEHNLELALRSLNAIRIH